MLLQRFQGYLFEEYMKVNILEALQMKESDFLNLMFQKNYLQRPYSWS